MDPNSQHQLWSHWTFTVREAGRAVPRADVELNAARWLRKGFGSAAAARVIRTLEGWRIEARVEGVPAHDPGYVAHVTRQFEERFVAQGWGMLASGDVAVRILAGSEQDGSPAKQWVSLPVLDLRNQVLPIKSWRVYYADGSAFDSTMGSWAEAPPFGVQAVVYYHVPPYKTLDGPDHGVYTYRGEGAQAHVKLGVFMDTEGFHRIMDLASRSVSP